MTDSNADTNSQPGLFDPSENFDAADVLKYALGDFQDRGFQLAGRELALDRLLGALKRACQAFDILPLKDEIIAGVLKELGVAVTEVPGFVAKHPYRFTIPDELAKESLEYFRSFKEK